MPVTSLPELAPEDDWTARAMARWPGIPATHGWLSLDARGRWCLQGAPATHEGLKRFLSQQYRRDADGAWYVQNGPQQVYVDLATAPHVAARDGTGAWITHTGVSLSDIQALVIDDEARLYFLCDVGLAGLDDRDWPTLLGELGMAPSQEDVGQVLLDLIEHPERERVLQWCGKPLPARCVASTEMERRFGFRRTPRG